jgi:hypothetical protein
MVTNSYRSFGWQDQTLLKFAVNRPNYSNYGENNKNIELYPDNHLWRCFGTSWYRPCRSYHRSYPRARKLPQQLPRRSRVLHQWRAQCPVLAWWVLWWTILRWWLLPLQLALLYRASGSDSFFHSRLQLGFQAPEDPLKKRSRSLPNAEERRRKDRGSV